MATCNLYKIKYLDDENRLPITYSYTECRGGNSRSGTINFGKSVEIKSQTPPYDKTGRLTIENNGIVDRESNETDVSRDYNISINTAILDTNGNPARGQLYINGIPFGDPTTKLSGNNNITLDNLPDEFLTQFGSNLTAGNLSRKYSNDGFELVISATSDYHIGAPVYVIRGGFANGNDGDVAFTVIVEEVVGGEVVETYTFNPVNEGFPPEGRLILGNINLQFTDNITVDTGDEPEPDEEPIEKVTINIIGDVVENNLVKYRASWGECGFVRIDESIQISNIYSNSDDNRYIEFTTNNISSNTYSVKYDVIEPGSNSVTTYDSSLNLKIDELLNGEYTIRVTVVKLGNEQEPEYPSIEVPVDVFEFNINSNDELLVDYSTSNSTNVFYKIGNTTNTIPSQGPLILTKDSFNEIGVISITLTPVIQVDIDIPFGGSVETPAILGTPKTITVNVVNKPLTDKPAITYVNYPSTINGPDFKGTNVLFNVSWNSINTSFVEVRVNSSNGNTISSSAPISELQFKVADIIQSSQINVSENQNVIQFRLYLIPVTIVGGTRVEGDSRELIITFNKGSLKLKRKNVINDILESFKQNCNINDDSLSYLTHLMHLGGANNRLISTWGIDTETFSTYRFNEETNQDEKINEERSLVLKLYEPLPREVNPNEKLWISKIKSIPIIDTITIVDDVSTSCTPLTPNFNIELGNDIGYEIYDELVASGSATSDDIVREVILNNELSLDQLQLLYENDSNYYWENFIKYSSAAERVDNFMYKVKLLESYEDKYLNLTSGSAWTGSVSIVNEAERTKNKIDNLKGGFDAFEKHLYFESSSLTFPGAGQNEVSASTDSEVTTWYTTIKSSALEYDLNNSNRLVNNIPQHVKDDDASSDFVLFLDMIGQHFDIIWNYIKGISQSKKIEHKYEQGITDRLIYQTLESLGWDTKMGMKSEVLWEYAFGKYKDGTQTSEMSGKSRQNETWRRILNNLPYLYKHKGTKRAIHALMSCYGVPASLLTVMEFGGPQDPTQGGTTTFTYEDRTAAINISGSENIMVPWKEYSITNEHPNSVEIRFNTTVRETQQIISSSGWNVQIEFQETGSLAVATLNVLSGSTFVSTSTEQFPFYTDEYSQIVVNRTSGSEIFDLYVKEGFQERIRNQASASLTVTGTSGWESGSYIYIGGNTMNGSVDEFRLWSQPLPENNIENHALMPEAIDGAHVSSSTDDLIFRLDFEYPKDRSSSGDEYIKNVSINLNYGESFATASNFTTVSSYPYQYTPYERTVTAKVPSTGINVGNKVRLESQTLISDLNVRSRSTRKLYDQAPVDSNRLGFFFSPVKEINLDILKSLGSFNIDNYIGNPSDTYQYEYKELKQLRNYYFDRYTLNLHEYIQLVRYIDKSLFETLESLAPARAKVASGLLIQPHILERSKVKWNRPESSIHDYESAINVEENVNADSTYDSYEYSIHTSQSIELSGESSNYEFEIDENVDPELSSDYKSYESNIDITTEPEIDGVNPTYESEIGIESTTQLEYNMIVNSGSDMGGISIQIDTPLSDTVIFESELDDSFTAINNSPDSLTKAFGIYAEDGNSIRTYIDKDNNFIKERVKVQIIKESYVKSVIENVNSNDPSLGTERVDETYFRNILNIQPFTGSNGLESTIPTVGGNIIEVTPLNGYAPTHYRNTGDLSTGLESSYFNGSRQTSDTTLDGGAPVETFTTNPNTLRVSDSGRGSGEPILEVE